MCHSLCQVTLTSVTNNINTLSLITFTEHGFIRVISQETCVKYDRRLVRDDMFAESNGDRLSAPNFIVLITDGRSDDRNFTWHEAMAARAQAITILAVSLK